MPETPTPPEDLIDLKTRWYAASERSAAIAAEPNRGDEVLLQLQAPAHAPGPSRNGSPCSPRTSVPATTRRAPK